MTSCEICSKYNYNQSYIKALATTKPDIWLIHSKEQSKNKLCVNNFQMAFLPTVQH